MRIVFWENIVSQHKVPYWNALAQSNEVSKFVLIVEQPLYEKLKNQGWENNIKETEKFELHINPSEEGIISLLQENIESSYHVFSGIKSIPMVYRALRISKKFQINRILLTESININGIRSITRRLASILIERRFKNTYDIILGSGAKTEKWYLECGVQPQNFYPFLYATKSIEVKPTSPDIDILKVVFIGRVEKAKGLDILLEAISLIKEKKIQLDIYGSLVEEDIFKKMVNDLNLQNYVNFKGVKSNSDLRNILHKYHLLCLPSRWDGWGAVINEAIASGLKVICSDRCGASILIINDKIGQIFNLNKPKELSRILEEIIEQKDNIDRDYILKYSRYLSGEYVAKYLIDILNWHYKNKGNRPLPPWESFQIKERL